MEDLYKVLWKKKNTLREEWRVAQHRQGCKKEDVVEIDLNGCQELGDGWGRCDSNRGRFG
jgi:hypothetical protein